MDGQTVFNQTGIPTPAEDRLANRGKSRADYVLHAIFIIAAICALFPFYCVVIGSFGTPLGRIVPMSFTLEMFFGGGLIPFYLTVKELGLIDNYLVMILPSAINTFYIWIMLSFFRQFPVALEESAKIDGAGDFTILVRIVVPTSLPVIASISLFYAVDRWNDWYIPMLFLSDVDKYPLQLMLRNMLTNIDQILSMNAGVSAIDQSKIRIPRDSLKMAAIVITCVPIMLVYPFLQKYFAKGVMIGSIKG
jgi:putative aldouronate transport system permease protein